MIKPTYHVRSEPATDSSVSAALTEMTDEGWSLVSMVPCVQWQRNEYTDGGYYETWIMMTFKK